MNTMKGQLGLRSSALAPTSSKITTQYLVLDHMNNHYRKIVGAKSAIDNKPPKALKSSQKVRDRKTRDYVKKTGSRPPSRMPSRPHSQMHYYQDYDNEEDWGDYDPDDEEEQMVQNILKTSLRPKSSSVNATHGSETQPTDRDYQYNNYANTDHTLNQTRPMSAGSKWMKTKTMMTAVRAITTPTSARGDKTYDGDLLEKRSHAFTEEKPFTPRTLKTKNRSSRLSEYKYYTPPPQKRSTKQEEEAKKKEAPTPKPRPRQSSKSPQRIPVDASMTDTLMFESLQSRDFSRFEDKEDVVPKLDISLDMDHKNWLQEQQYRSKVREKSGTLKSTMSQIREDEMMASTDLDQTKGMSTLDKTGTRNFGTGSGSQRLKKEEEELKYMEFMKDVTDDVLTRGVFTNRVLKQVFDSHIRKRKGELNEKKMRSMLGKVRSDLGIPHDDNESTLDDTRLGETVSTSSFKLRPSLARFEQSKVSDVTFDSTVDSQNTYKFKSTSSADMFSTIRSENEDLSGSQALRDYQMNLTRKAELSEGEVTPEESEKHDETKVIHVASRADDNASVHSRGSKARSVQSHGSKARSVGHASVQSHGSKAVSAGKGSEHVASPKHSSRAASARDDDTLTEKSRHEPTDDGEYEDDDFTDSDGEF